jgi:adenylate cyclase
MRLGTGSAMARVPLLPRGSLFRQYFFVLFAAVVVPLLAAGGNYTISG